MYTAIISSLAEILKADFKEVELLFMMIVMVIAGIFYKWVKVSKDSPYPFFNRKLYGGLVGFLIHYQLLGFYEFIFLNTYLVAYFMILNKYNQNDKQKFWISMVGFIMHATIGIYIIAFYYGIWYSTHMFMITMLISPKMMFYLWKAHGMLIFYLLIFRGKRPEMPSPNVQLLRLHLLFPRRSGRTPCNIR
jgi:hypothetical protein